MKSILFLSIIGLVSFVCVSTVGHTDAKYDFGRSDSITQVGITSLQKHKIIYEKAQDNLLDNLLHARSTDIHSDRKVGVNPCIIIKTKQVYKTVIVPKYIKVVYSLYTPRGFHQRIDTIESN